MEASPALEQAGARFEAGGAAGAAGLREFQFRATRAGTHELRLKNRREWEGEGAIIDHFEIRLIAR